MKKNIMLLFLSPLGDDVKAQKYIGYMKDGEKTQVIEGTQTNESPIKYVISYLGKGESLDEIYYFETEKVKEKTINNTLSSQEFLEQAIQKYCEDEGYAVPQFRPIPFNEIKKDADNQSEQQVELALKSVLSMVKEIEKAGEMRETNVYVDITGGFRYSTMLLVTIMRLLQFNGIKMQKVIYSDKDNGNIVDVTKIYELHDLVSGASEFSRFGSVNLLKEYYKNTSSKALEELIKKMDNFSESLQLCKAKEFREELKHLRQAIQEFKQNVEKSDEDRLFEVLLARVEQDYKDIIKEDASVPSIIKWCARKGFIQQALTLYVELIPEYLVTSGLIYPIDKEKEEKKIKKVTYRGRINSSKIYIATI